MTSLFLHFLKRDSRSSHTWIIRTILSALILLLAGWDLADESIPSVTPGMFFALIILGGVAVQTNLNAFRENGWRETLMLVHSTCVRPGELFLVQLAARSVPCLLCVLPVLVLLMELDNRAGTLFWLPCATYAFCAILFGLGAGMFSSCLSTRSSIVGSERNYAGMVWMLFVMFPLMLTHIITSLWDFWSAGAGDILAIVGISCAILAIVGISFFWLPSLLGFSPRQMIGCLTGRADRLTLLTLMGFILIPFVFVLLSGTVFKYWVYPAALALVMIPLALACLHLACRVERDPEYFQNSLRWRFLAPMLDRLRSGEDKLQAKLAKLGVSKSLPIHATAAHASDSVPSRPGTWANAYLGVNDGGTSPRPAFFGRMRSMRSSEPVLMSLVLLLMPFIVLEIEFPTNRIKDIFFIAGMEFFVFLVLMVRASFVLRGDRRSGMLDLVLVSPLSSRGITDGVLHSFADIRREYLLYLAVAGGCVLTFSHLSLWRGDGWNEWSVCIYVPLSIALCHSGRLKSLWILSCRDGLRHARSGVVLLRPLAVLVVPYGVFLSFFALAGNEPVRLALCILFPFLHQRILDHMARRSMTGLLRMHHSMHE